MQNNSIISIFLKGFSQIMLQENALTGLLFLVGITYGSINLGIAALLAVICGTYTAKLLHYEKSEIERGLYGFSAALVGVGMIVFFKPTFICWLLIIVGAMAATIIQHFFIQRKIPVFTLPFVLVLWMMIYFIGSINSNLTVENVPFSTTSANYLVSAIKSYGQVIFQGSIISGVLFLVAVLISSPIAAFYGFLGALFANFVCLGFSIPMGEIGLGLFGYNAVLCAITFAGNKFIDGIWVAVSVILSIVTDLLLFHYDIVRLTFPFVLASCVTLLIKTKISSKSTVKD